MTGIPLYLLKVSLGLGIVSAPYFFLLRKDPNLVVKRFYLLLGILASWIFPLLVFRRPQLLTGITPAVFINPLEGNTLVPAHGGSTAVPVPRYRGISWPVFVYLAGLIFQLFRNMVILFRWNRTWHRNRDQSGIAYTGTGQAFTLFSRIFIPKELKGLSDLDNILLHERAHREQLHFIDLVLMELTLVLTWFNPFSWLISRMIKENHEHLADRKVLSAGVNPVHYRAQLLNHTLGLEVFRLGNPFNHSFTSKRFHMMKKPEKSVSATIKIALLVPAILLALGCAIGAAPGHTGTIEGKVVLGDSGEPAPGASVIIANTNTGTVTDEKGYFTLKAEGEPVVVISFVGYETLRIPSSEISRRPLKLERKEYTLDLGDNPGNKISFRASEPQRMPGGTEDTPKAIVPDEGVFFVVEDMPMFPGGKEALKDYIYSLLQYPSELHGKGIPGEVTVRFTVTAKGALENLRVARCSRPEFKKPALDVFRDMPAWNPGRQHGKPVKVDVLMPIRFVPEMS